MWPSGQAADDLVVEHAVGADRGIVFVGDLAVAVGEATTGFLDHLVIDTDDFDFAETAALVQRPPASSTIRRTAARS